MSPPHESRPQLEERPDGRWFLPSERPRRITVATCEEDLRLLILIRKFEELVLKLFSTGAIKGTTHTCIGQEIVPVALRALLAPADYVFSNHRGHGHYLARYEDPRGLLAEIMGRVGAVCSGVGGSQHIKRDRYLSTGVIGQGLAVAAGVALYLRDTAPGALAVAYIGDGTWGQGIVYEALNMAALWDLPLLVVVENNRIAQSTPAGSNMAGSIAGRAAAFGIEHRQVPSSSVDEIRAVAAPLVARARLHAHPLVLEFDVPRLAPHSKGDDTRSDAELAELRARDWHGVCREEDPARLARLEEEVAAQLDDLAAELQRAPLSQWCV